MDGDGNLAAVYRGPVDADQLLADLRTLSLDGERRYEVGQPFEGRWLVNAPQLRPLPLAIELANGGYDDDALAFIRQNADVLARDAGFGSFAAEMTRKLLSQEDVGAARSHLTQAIRIAPRDASLRAQLGDIDYVEQRWEAAAKRFREALSLDPRT